MDHTLQMRSEESIRLQMIDEAKKAKPSDSRLYSLNLALTLLLGSIVSPALIGIAIALLVDAHPARGLILGTFCGMVLGLAISSTIEKLCHKRINGMTIDRRVKKALEVHEERAKQILAEENSVKRNLLIALHNLEHSRRELKERGESDPRLQKQIARVKDELDAIRADERARAEKEEADRHEKLAQLKHELDKPIYDRVNQSTTAADEAILLAESYRETLQTMED